MATFIRDLASLIAASAVAAVDAARCYRDNACAMLLMGPPYYETTSHAHMDKTGSTRVYLDLTMSERIRSAITGRRR